VATDPRSHIAFDAFDAEFDSQRLNSTAVVNAPPIFRNQ
jgi:hypothetical protein